MVKLNIEGTAKTPKIYFDHLTGKLEISGVSVPENAIEFYTPVYNWLKEYVKNPQEKTIVSFKISYLNTSSLQFLHDIFFKLNQIEEPPKVIIDWYYHKDDIDLKETGEDFRSAIDLAFNFIPLANL